MLEPTKDCEVVATPNIDQMHVVNHYTGRKWMNIEMLVESSKLPEAI